MLITAQECENKIFKIKLSIIKGVGSRLADVMASAIEQTMQLQVQHARYY